MVEIIPIAAILLLCIAFDIILDIAVGAIEVD